MTLLSNAYLQLFMPWKITVLLYIYPLPKNGTILNGPFEINLSKNNQVFHIKLISKINLEFLSKKKT